MSDISGANHAFTLPTGTNFAALPLKRDLQALHHRMLRGTISYHRTLSEACLLIVEGQSCEVVQIPVEADAPGTRRIGRLGGIGEAHGESGGVNRQFGVARSQFPCANSERDIP